MKSCSSALRLAATGWLMSRQCTSSAPCSSVPVGSVPGIRLDRAQNALRLPPSGRRNGQATNPGCSRRFGVRARHATSHPETTDWRKKLAASDAIAASLYRDPNGGRKRKLTQAAPTTAAIPTGRSAGAHPEIMSQKARKNAARTAATRARLREPFPAGALNAAIQGRKRRRHAVRSTTAQRARCGNSAHAHRPNGSASAFKPLCCDAGQSYHVHSNGESAGPPRLAADPIDNSAT